MRAEANSFHSISLQRLPRTRKDLRVDKTQDDEEVVSPQREELRKWRLPPQILIDCQREYAGVVSLASVWRTEATIRLQSDERKLEGEIRFYLPKDELIEAQLRDFADAHIRYLKQEDPALWGFCRHIAVEAMLAVRNSHKSYVRHKRAKKQQADAL